MSKSVIALFCLLLSGSCWAATGDGATEAATGAVACDGTSVNLPAGSSDYCIARELWLKGDHAAAERRLRRAARLNNAPAQYLLGIASFNGDGLKLDRAQGLAWLAMASYSGREDYLGTFRSAYWKASADERAQAQKILDRQQRQLAWRLLEDDGARGRERDLASSIAMGWPGPTLIRSERMGPAPTNVIAAGGSRR